MCTEARTNAPGGASSIEATGCGASPSTSLGKRREVKKTFPSPRRSCRRRASPIRCRNLGMGAIKYGRDLGNDSDEEQIVDDQGFGLSNWVGAR